MAKEKTTVGIDIGSRNVKVTVVRFEEINGKRVSRLLGTGSAVAYGMRHGFVQDVEEASASLAEAVSMAEKAAGFKIRRAEISIGESGLAAYAVVGQTIIGRADMEITNLDISRASESSEESLPKVMFQNRRIIHRIPVEAKIDGQQVFGTSPIGMKGGKLEVKSLFVACTEQNLSRLAKVFENNDMEISGANAAPVAASLSCLSKSQKIAGAILADIGAENTSIIVYEDGVPVSLEIIGIGGQDITKDIALGLKISIEEAESIKVGAVTKIDYSKKKLEEIIEARLSDIFELIEGHLKKIGRNRMLPAGIFLTGGSAKIAGLENFARDFLKLPAKIVSVSAGQVGKNLEPVWSTAYGLCLIGATNDHGGLPVSGGKGPGMKDVLNWFKQFLP